MRMLDVRDSLYSIKVYKLYMGVYTPWGGGGGGGGGGGVGFRV